MLNQAADPIKESWDQTRGVMKPIQEALFTRLGDQVKRGPFTGMRLGQKLKWDDGNLSNKLIGAYESELHNTFKKIAQRKPDTIINIGCAEGYYAVGFARMFPDATIYALDLDNDSLDLCEENARNNNVKNIITCVGKAGPENLDLGQGKRLFFVDIEGDEFWLLDKTKCPLLNDSDIIVECHDFFFLEYSPNVISKELQERFSDSHDVELITEGIPCPSDYPWLSGLPMGTVLLAITEKRPSPTVWLACWTKQTKGN